MTPTELHDHLVAIVQEGLRLMLVLLAALAIYLIFVGFAMAIECRERPDKTTYSSYRIIDGQRCWYKGHRVIPKSRLHWSDDEPKAKKLKGVDPVFNKIRAEVKTVDPNDLNELDAQASVKPLPMFPYLTEKVEALINLWNHRWDSK